MATRLAWLTDIHLNFLGTVQVGDFIDALLDHDPDAVLITGDIGESHSLVPFLQRMAARISRPIYFVLGNHDFYFSSIGRVRPAVARLCRETENLFYLPLMGVVELAPGTALVGVDGWGDGRCGDYDHSPVILNDFVLIRELANKTPDERLKKLHALGDEAGAALRRTLPGALAAYPRVLVAIHVPPFREACWHNGAMSDDDFLPHFTCKAAGDALLEIVPAHPEVDVTVLCGHTHDAAEVRMADNLLVLAGAAEYGAPHVLRVLELD